MTQHSTRVALQILPHGEDLPLPAYQTVLSAGADLIAAVPEAEPILIVPMQRARVPTGLQMALPAGFEAQIRPRSGLALRHGITCLNTPGTIDADYRGELQVLLINLGEDAFTVTRGMRMAQLVIAPVTQASFEIVTALDETERGDGGFGSTGQA